MRGIGRSRSTTRGEGCVKKRAATRNRGPALQRNWLTYGDFGRADEQTQNADLEPHY
jgi:hypothetical protein